MSRDTSFYYSFLVLPPARRGAIIAVWDFCRAVDDAVDEVEQGAGGAAPAEQLRRWRDELARCFGDGTPMTTEGRALVPHIRRFNLSRQPFEDVIDGVAMDLDAPRYATFADLKQYCYRVASAVGLICVEIFGYREPATRVYAEELGLALQLTNIIRDVAADLRKGRVYLPEEDLRRFGVDEAMLRAGRVTPEVRNLLAFECGRAHEYFNRAARALPRRDRRRLVAAEIMGRIYYAVLEGIERSGYDVFSRRIRVPRSRRAVIALQVYLRRLAGL